jgi:hypothetical protein
MPISPANQFFQFISFFFYQERELGPKASQKMRHLLCAAEDAQVYALN